MSGMSLRNETFLVKTLTTPNGRYKLLAQILSHFEARHSSTRCAKFQSSFKKKLILQTVEKAQLT